MDVIYDVYTHPSGKPFEASVEEATRAFRARHGCEPAAVWINPSEAPFGDTVNGLPLIRNRHMNPWYVYLEVPGGQMQMTLPAVEEAADLDLVAAESGPVQMALLY